MLGLLVLVAFVVVAAFVSVAFVAGLFGPVSTVVLLAVSAAACKHLR